MFLLFFGLQSVAATERDEVCTPFKTAEIDQSLISTMLNAAKKGHLYRVKDNTSQMGFCVESSIGVVNGEFKKFKGGIALQGNQTQAMLAIDVDSLETDAGFIKRLLKGDDFFNVEDYPEVVFVSTGFEWMSDTDAVLKGELTMHGVTKPVGFYVEIFQVDSAPGESGRILVKATTTVLRSEFGMTALPSMVNDKVNLCMSVEAEKFAAL